MESKAQPNSIKTNRLILRPWREEDLEPFAKMNGDPRVMEYFPGILMREESDRLAKRIMQHFDDHGFGLWAVTVPNKSEFIGLIGLNTVPFSAHFTPAIEVGWRLAYDFWGQGYATEGAQAALTYGFEQLNLDEIVSFTTLTNKRSSHVMKKLGMHTHPDENFNHPNLAEGHELSRHVLYRLKKTEWKSRSE